MKSIRKRLFIQIVTLTTLMIISLLIFNNSLAERYYLYQQKSQLVDYFEIIETHIIKDILYNDILENAESLGINISIITLSSEEKENFEKNEHPRMPEPTFTVISSEQINENIVINQIQEIKFGIENMTLVGQVSNQLIEIRVPLHHIQAGIEVANQILLIIGIIFILLAMIVAFILAKGFTKPILDMTLATEKMKNLDFDIKCEVSTQDELGALANNINHMSQNLSQTIETLQIRDLRRKELLNNVSHELKTPLTLMQGYATALQHKVITQPEQSTFYTEVIIDEVIKMTELVETLLDIDQLETQKKKLTLATFEINEFITEISNKFKYLATQKGIAFEVLLSTNCEVTCDPLLIEQVLKNLISNAISYMGDKRLLTIELLNYDTTIRVNIINDSEFISSEMLNKIWEPFYKIDNSRSEGGHGLGLSIVKAIQDAHNTKCGAKMTLEGVCFWFELNKK